MKRETRRIILPPFLLTKNKIRTKIDQSYSPGEEKSRDKKKLGEGEGQGKKKEEEGGQRRGEQKQKQGERMGSYRPCNTALEANNPAMALAKAWTES